MASSKIKIIEILEKGELKIPKSVLEQLPFAPMGKFLILQGKDFITLKKVGEAPPRERFQAIAKEVQKKAKALKISKKVAKEAVAWARKKS